MAGKSTGAKSQSNNKSNKASESTTPPVPAQLFRKDDIVKLTDPPTAAQSQSPALGVVDNCQYVPADFETHSGRWVYEIRSKHDSAQFGDRRRSCYEAHHLTLATEMEVVDADKAAKQARVEAVQSAQEQKEEDARLAKEKADREKEEKRLKKEEEKARKKEEREREKAKKKAMKAFQDSHEDKIMPRDAMMPGSKTDAPVKFGLPWESQRWRAREKKEKEKQKEKEKKEKEKAEKAPTGFHGLGILAKRQGFEQLD